MTKSALSLALVACLAFACSDDGGGGGSGGGGGLPDASSSVFPDAPGVPDARPDARASTTPDGGAGLLACSLDEITPIFTCAAENCLTIPTDLPDGGGLPTFDFASLGICVATNCFSEFLDVSPTCQSCLLGAFTGGTADAIGGCVTGGLPELPGLPTP